MAAEFGHGILGSEVARRAAARSPREARHVSLMSFVFRVSPAWMRPPLARSAPGRLLAVAIVWTSRRAAIPDFGFRVLCALAALAFIGAAVVSAVTISTIGPVSASWVSRRGRSTTIY